VKIKRYYPDFDGTRATPAPVELNFDQVRKVVD
jgi:hypothetical protein